MKAHSHAWNVVTSVIAEVLDGVDAVRVDPDTRLVELGANSVDRVEIVTLSMERLDVRIPQTRFATVRNVGDLVDTLARHRHAVEGAI